MMADVEMRRQMVVIVVMMMIVEDGGGNGICRSVGQTRAPPPAARC